jgi:hypothetical protein
MNDTSIVIKSGLYQQSYIKKHTCLYKLDSYNNIIITNIVVSDY